jgi:hypothetical protein
MKLTELQEEWKKDSVIDETNLGRAAAKTPQLHAKYLNLLTSAKLQQRKAESDYLKLRRVKYRYFRGELNRDELQALGWDQYQGVKPIKNEMDEFLQTDEDLITAQDKLEYLRTVLLQLESILKSLHSRTWDIKNSIEWTKFTNGMM